MDVGARVPSLVATALRSRGPGFGDPEVATGHGPFCWKAGELGPQVCSGSQFPHWCREELKIKNALLPSGTICDGFNPGFVPVHSECLHNCAFS